MERLIRLIPSQNGSVFILVKMHLTILKKQVNAEVLSISNEPVTGAISLVIQSDKFYILTTAVVDTTIQKEQMEKELEYLRGFVASLDKKLLNERFIQNAKPEVVAFERKKKEDSLSKIRTLEESISLI